MGFFSWNTQDTNKSIASMYSNRPCFTVYMVNPKTMESYKEDVYEGYGVFGDKDFYDLVAELNPELVKECIEKNISKDETELRCKGIDIVYNLGKKYISPILVEHLENAKDYIGQAPEECKYQGYFYPEELFFDSIKELVEELPAQELINFLREYDEYVTTYYEYHGYPCEPVCMLEYFNNDYQEDKE